MEIVQKFFYFLRDEAVILKLVQNKVHGVDGQFFRSWLCHKKPRRSGLPQFWGDWYNHGGSKKGVGVYQMPLVDISPYCVIPLYPHVVPANKNENITGWETVEGAKQNYSKSSPFFVADCGLCGTDMQEEVKTRPSIPIIPIRENMKRNLYISPLRHHHFSHQYLGRLKGALVDFLYDLRQAIERWHHFFDDVFDLVRIHACGKDHMLQIIITAEAITTLIAITALKIGRPDLIQTPTAFQSLIGTPPIIIRQVIKKSIKSPLKNKVGSILNSYEADRSNFEIVDFCQKWIHRRESSQYIFINYHSIQFLKKNEKNQFLNYLALLNSKFFEVGN